MTAYSCYNCQWSYGKTDHHDTTILYCSLTGQPCRVPCDRHVLWKREQEQEKNAADSSKPVVVASCEKLPRI